MSQYTPMAKAEEFSEINRKITKREYDKVIDYAIMKNIKKVYVQEMSSADKSYIPNFDLYGV
jgi:putative pyruvate formate lyase activating enzyme